jgi:putative adenylate-forming enzyme
MSGMVQLAATLWAYWRARRLRFGSRAELEAHQARQLARHLEFLHQESPYFRPYGDLPLIEWPRMDKGVMLANFDAMNTGGLHLADVFSVALRSEAERDFAPLLHGYTVGLSSGTSGQRGVFVASAAERAAWAGIMLAKALPRGLFAGERVALFLRSNSTLYSAIESRFLAFRFFDLFAPLEAHMHPLASYAPTVLVAPAQVLRMLALAKLDGRLPLAPRKVISVAEVLEVADRALIEQAFGPVHELYQATEGFLAATCAHGTLHLNEEFLHVEPEWLDAARTRFVPVITDFTRTTQPIVRYRLNDVLVRRSTPCPCGAHTLAIEAIEGRSDDLLELPGKQGGTVPAFADVLSRALAQVLPLSADYSLVQDGPESLVLSADVAEHDLGLASEHLDSVLAALGADTDRLAWRLIAAAPAADLTAKRRRIRKTFAAAKEAP